MGYIIPTPRQFTVRSVPMRRRLSSLGLPYLQIRGEENGGTTILPFNRRRIYPPLPVTPALSPVLTTPTPSPTPPSIPTPAPPSGYCVVTSSPETGGITSVVPCASGQGGTPIPGSGAPPVSYAPTPTPSVTSPVPSTQPLNQPYTDSYGNVWTYGPSGWQITGNVASALPVSSPAGAVGAPSYTGGTTTVNTGSGYQSVLDWLSEQTLISGIPNWGVAGAAAALLLVLKNRGQGGRR